MDFFISGRQTGKTAILIDWVKMQPDNEWRVIVVSNHEQLAQVTQRLGEADVENPDRHVCTINSTRYLHGRKNVRLGIDNIDLMLSSIFGQSVDIVTGTGGDMTHYD